MIPHLWFRFMDTDGEFLFLRVTSQVAVLAGELVRLGYLLATAARVEYRFAKCTVTYNKQCAVQTGFLVIRFAYQ